MAHMARPHAAPSYTRVRPRRPSSRRLSLPLLIRAACMLALAWGLTGASAVAGARARRPAKSRETDAAKKAAREDEFAARRLLKRAQDLLLAKEADRAVKMFETIIEQHPNSATAFEAYLALGKHFIEKREYPRAINYFRHLNALKTPDEDLTGRPEEIYLEGLYLTGVAHFQMRQFAAAFPILRKITNNYPNSVWANQSYYYIGMCHFAQSNWNKAIRALSLVGTFVDPNSPTVQYAEAGRRFYVKIEDADLPVLHRLGKELEVGLATKHGDKETLRCIPLAGEQGIFISSIATQIGPAKAGDNVLQVIGGDLITTHYVDDNTKQGEKSVPREKKVQVVSTAALRFTLGTFESKASAAFLGQPLFVLLQDVDQDSSPNPDAVAVKVVSRYKQSREDDVAAEGLTAAIDFRPEDEVRYETRDEVVLKLGELGAAPVHTGRFGGKMSVEPMREGQPIDKTDAVLTSAIGDEIVASYVDELHIAGKAPREALATVNVIGEIDGRPRATQNVVPDPILKAKKNLVETTAYLELAKIFRSMGLVKGAKEKADEGLERVDTIIRIQSPIPSALKEEAFKLKWELYTVQDDFPSAIATCKLFNRLYPDSPFVDQALVGIGTIRMENKEYREAINVFRQILSLPNSQAKAEAQFRIAEATEASSTPEQIEGAIQQYKLCADRYPESEYAGRSLAKLVDYYVSTKDYARADDLLEQVFQDYPDGDFLDSMLLKWVLVAYRMGDFAKSQEKCSQLIFEYPASAHAKKAKEILPRIERKIKADTKEGKSEEG